MSSNRNNDQACAEYFKNQKIYQRCFQELWKKWRSYGKPTGRITLKHTSGEERRGIGGITGKVFYEKDIRFTFAEFEQGLQKTRFAPVDMKKVLEGYFGEELVTKQDQKKKTQKQKEDFLKDISKGFRGKSGTKSVAYEWTEQMLSTKKYGYQILIREFEKDPDQAGVLAENVGNALEKLHKISNTEEQPLAVFAAEISGNPHYFDRGTTAGLLLVRGICCIRKTEVPENAYQWRELMETEGIIPDNVSSMLHVYGLRLKKGTAWHPAYEAFCEEGEPCVITMENLKGITEVQPLGKNVFIVENEMVFSYLIDNLPDKNCTLLCTSGQLRFVSQKLLSLILENGTDVYYSGDIDPDGMGIADRLWMKFGDRIHMWRMSPEDYEKSISREHIGENGLAKLFHIHHPLLEKTAEYVKQKQLSGYQENILKELLSDIKKAGEP